jgi:hypothetical protein
MTKQKLLLWLIESQSNNTKRAVVPEPFSLSKRRLNQKKNANFGIFPVPQTKKKKI